MKCLYLTPALRRSGLEVPKRETTGAIAQALVAIDPEWLFSGGCDPRRSAGVALKLDERDGAAELRGT